MTDVVGAQQHLEIAARERADALLRNYDVAIDRRHHWLRVDQSRRIGAEEFAGLRRPRPKCHDHVDDAHPLRVRMIDGGPRARKIVVLGVDTVDDAGLHVHDEQGGFLNVVCHAPRAKAHRQYTQATCATFLCI